MRKFFLTLVFCAVFLPFLEAKRAASPLIHVSITKGYKKQLVLAFPKLYVDAVPANLAQELEEFIRLDLKLSGRVILLEDQARINQIAAKESISKTDPVAWNALGIEKILKVQLSSPLGSLQAKFSIFDSQGRCLTQGTQTGSKKSFRDLVYKISEAIVFALTGEHGLSETRIAFGTDVKGEKTIFSCDIQGRNVLRLVSNKSLVLCPVWGPRRETILYTSYQSINPGLFLKNLTSNRVDAVSTFPGVNVNGKINSNNEVLFTASRDGNPEIYYKNLNTGIVNRLTRRLGVDANPCWSSDNSQIAFVSSAEGNPHIYLMNRNGQNINRLTYSGSYNTNPAYSPDGKTLAFSSMQANYFNIALFDFQQNRMDLLVTRMKNAESPSWSPNSKNIVFASDKTGQWELNIINVETQEIFQVTHNLGNCTNPSWA